MFDEIMKLVSEEICGHTHYIANDGAHVHCTLAKNHIGDHRCDLGEYAFHWLNTAQHRVQRTGRSPARMSICPECLGPDGEHSAKCSLRPRR